MPNDKVDETGTLNSANSIDYLKDSLRLATPYKMAVGLMKAYLMHYDSDAHISKMHEHGMMHTPIDLQRHALKHAPINAIMRFPLYTRSNGPNA